MSSPGSLIEGHRVDVRAVALAAALNFEILADHSRKHEPYLKIRFHSLQWIGLRLIEDRYQQITHSQSISDKK